MVRSFSARDGLFAAIDCADWEDFRRTARETLKAHAGTDSISDRYLFRGQSCSSWGLEPSFDRANASLAPAQRDAKYDEQMKLFRENYAVYGDIGKTVFTEKFDDFSSLDNDKVEAIAQHYGLSTRLLDWSLSMYVAAFFALSRTDLCTSGKVSIWALDSLALKSFSRSEIVLSRDLYKGNVRNLWQMGMFIKNHTPFPDISDLFKGSSRSYDHKLDSGHPKLIRFDFPVSGEQEILDDLQMMRINSMTIFPGMEGVVSWIRRKSGLR